MKIHEYQAKEILARYGVRIPRGEVAYSKEEARQIAANLGGTVVVKAQIHAGGRGKGGGVKLARTPDEAAELTGKMLGMNLVTAQTGPEGRQVQKVLIEEGLNIRKELYLGIVIDRQTGKPVFTLSRLSIKRELVQRHKLYAQAAVYIIGSISALWFIERVINFWV